MRSKFIEALSITACPRQEVASGDWLLRAGDPTDKLIYLLSGSAKGSDAVGYSGSHVVNFPEFFAQDEYVTDVSAKNDCLIVHIPRALIRDTLCGADPLTWTLARAVAAENISISGRG